MKKEKLLELSVIDRILAECPVQVIPNYICQYLEDTHSEFLGKLSKDLTNKVDKGFVVRVRFGVDIINEKHIKNEKST